MVSRWAYVFSDFMCGDLAIKPLPGKHMPPKQDCKFHVVNPGLDVSTRNSSYASCQTEVKEEKEDKYVPRDHTAFTASIDKTDDFPSLGGRKSKVDRKPLSNNFAVRAPRNDWNVPLNRNSEDLEDSFKMPRR